MVIRDADQIQVGSPFRQSLRSMNDIAGSGT